MSALKKARAALSLHEQRAERGWHHVGLEAPFAAALRDLITYSESLESEMHQRELHHFEAETALGVIKNCVENAVAFGDEIEAEEILAMIPADI